MSTIKKPKKGDYRQRAHSNPLSDSLISHPTSPLHVDWSKHFAEFYGLQENYELHINTSDYPITYNESAEDNHVNGLTGPKVEFLDVGCGYGGLLVSLSGLYPRTLILGMEIRETVADYVGERIRNLRKESSANTQVNYPTKESNHHTPQAENSISHAHHNKLKIHPNIELIAHPSCKYNQHINEASHDNYDSKNENNKQNGGGPNKKRIRECFKNTEKTEWVSINPRNNDTDNQVGKQHIQKDQIINQTNSNFEKTQSPTSTSQSVSQKNNTITSNSLLNNTPEQFKPSSNTNQSQDTLFASKNKSTLADDTQKEEQDQINSPLSSEVFPTSKIQSSTNSISHQLIDNKDCKTQLTKSPDPSIEILKSKQLEPSEKSSVKISEGGDKSEDVRTPGLYNNIAILRTNVMKFIINYFHKGQLSKIFFCFPDPHFKRSNWKRRIISASMLSQYAYVLKPNGLIYAITDVHTLHQWMYNTCKSHPLFEEVPAQFWVDDPCVPMLSTQTEESMKVNRNQRKSYTCIFRRKVDPPYPV